MNALPAYDGRYIKTKIRTYDDKVYTNFCGLNVSEDGVECEFCCRSWRLSLYYLWG